MFTLFTANLLFYTENLRDICHTRHGHCSSVLREAAVRRTHTLHAFNFIAEVLIDFSWLLIVENTCEKIKLAIFNHLGNNLSICMKVLRETVTYFRTAGIPAKI